MGFGLLSMTDLDTALELLGAALRKTALNLQTAKPMIRDLV